MKTLKKVSGGLIAYNNFNNGTLTEPFKNKANSEYSNGKLIINRGSIELDAYPYPDLVLEVENSYVPINVQDMGGISLNKNIEKRELFEYYQMGDPSLVPFVRVVKRGDVYTGYGSETGTSWTDKGYVYFPGVETMSVTVVGDSPYPINSLKVYKKPYITIYSLLPGWRVIVKNGFFVVATKMAESSTAHVTLPNYPFTGSFEVYDADNVLVASANLSDVWGGDEYICMADVTLLTLDDFPLTDSSVTHLGFLNQGKIEECFKVKNNGTDTANITIRVAEYSVFHPWVHLSNDYGNAPGIYGKSIDITIPGLEEELFWVRVSRPPEFNLQDFNYRENECNFYLEVV